MLIQGSEVLVNVVRVPAVGNLAPLASVTVPHGLKLASRGPITPDLIWPWSATCIAVSAADDTTVTFTNIDPVNPTFALFRISYDHTIITRPVDPVWWQGHGGGGGGGGLSELTQDVLAGPGAGSQPATVVGLQMRPVAAAAPGAGQVLTWDGATWTPTSPPSSLPPSGAAGGDLAGTYPNPIVDGLQNRPVAATAPSAAEVLTWTGATWAPAPVAASSTIGILRFTLAPIQDIPDSVTSFQPTTTFHRFTVSGGNHNIVAIPTIVWPGAVPGQVVILNNVNPTGGNWVRLNRGVPEALALSNANKQIDPGGTMALVYNGSIWVEVTHTQATRT